MLTIGLTGDVGAGKSTLSRVLKKMGATVIDADSVARNLWKLSEVRKTAEKRWGKDFFKDKSSVVYSKIANIIFNNEDEYDFVTKLLHKRTLEELKILIDESDGLVIVEIPLLFECDISDWFDGIIYVTAEIDKRSELIARRNWNMEEVLRREAKMMPRGEKISRSDWILENKGSLKEWKAKSKELGKLLLSKV